MKIYFHSRLRLFSIVENNKVIGHEPCVTLERARFIVNKKGQARVRREKQKNVHAYIMGKPANFTIKRSLCKAVWYDPYKTDFFTSEDGPVHRADFVRCEIIKGKPAIWILK